LCRRPGPTESKGKMFVDWAPNSPRRPKNALPIKAKTRQSRVCSMCAKEFVLARVDAYLCSDACKQRAYRLRKQAASQKVENVGAQ
jgi:hypothetical protein